MEILGIGMSELLFVIIIALIVLGPKDMQKAGRSIGRWLRNIVTSDGWKVFQQTSRELRNLPNRLMREANEEVNKIGNDINRDINASGSARPRHDTLTPPRSRPVTPTTPPAETPTTEKESPKAEAPNDSTDTNA